MHVDLRVGELIEISPLLAATRAQFLERWDGRTRAHPRDVLNDLVQARFFA